MAKTRKTARKAKKPKEGSEAWYIEQQQNPKFIISVMQDLSNEIARGNTWAGASLNKWIAKYPDIAKTLSKLGDLCATTEAEWVKSMAGDNPVEQGGVKDEIARMKAELLGEKPSILEKVLITSIVAARLAHQRALIWAARPAPQQAVATARDRRVESTARWLLTALKSLAVVRQQQVRGLAPRAKLKVFDATA